MRAEQAFGNIGRNGWIGALLVRIARSITIRIAKRVSNISQGRLDAASFVARLEILR
jgi:hypothetical protein